MDHARLHPLLDAYLDHRLGEADRAALSAALASSPAACRVFWEAVHQHALLAELVAEGRGRALARQEQARAVRLFQPADGAPAPPPPRRARLARVVRRWLGLAAAALLLACAASWLLTRPGPRDDVGPEEAGLARLAELHGEVEVVAHDERRPARAGQRILAGEEIRTGEASSAVVAYADSSRVELTAHTQVQLLAQAGPDEALAGKHLFLVTGAVNASVTPQPLGRPLVLSTSQAVLLGASGRFRSASVLGETRVEVEAGKALLGRKGDRRKLELFTGTYAVAAGDGELTHPAPLLPGGGEPYAVFHEASGPVLALAALGERALAIGCASGTVKLWDVRTRKAPSELHHPFRVLSLAATRDGRTLAVGCANKPKGEPGVVVWDLPRRRQAAQLRGVRNVYALGFTADGQTLALADKAHTGALVWDTADARERLILGERRDRVPCLAVSPDGKFVAAGCRDGKVRVWDLLTGRVTTTLDGPAREVQALAYHPGGRVLAGGSRDGVVRLWSLPGGEEVHRLSGKFKEVRCLAFAPDGATLASSHGGTVILWDAAAGLQRSTLKAHQFAVTALAYLPDGRTLATAGWDRTVKLWDLQPAGE